MTKRTVDAAVIQRRLLLMDTLLADLRAIGVVTEARLADDAILRYGVERILTQLVDTAVAINSHIAATLIGRTPDDYRSTFSAAAQAGALSSDLASRLAPSVGLRNVLVHDYTETDFTIFTAAVPRAILDYGDYVASVARFLARGPSA